MHTCHASRCNQPVPRKIFMCAKHWAMVPKEMQDAIWKHYAKGQESGRAPVTQAYINAAMTAQNYVCFKEGYITEERYNLNVQERASREASPYRV